MYKAALHPYLMEAMGLGQPPMDPSMQQMDPNAQQAMDPNSQPMVDPNAQQMDPNAQQAMDPNAQQAPAEPLEDPLSITKEEGLFAIESLQIVNLLQKLLRAKYSLLLMYYHYGAYMKGVIRDGLYNHFKEHAKEEKDSAYNIVKKIVALGGEAPAKIETIKPVTNVQEILLTILAAEQKIQGSWRELDAAAGENLALKSFAQEQCLLDCQHADDIRRYLRGEE